MVCSRQDSSLLLCPSIRTSMFGGERPRAGRRANQGLVTIGLTGYSSLCRRDALHLGYPGMAVVGQEWLAQFVASGQLQQKAGRLRRSNPIKPCIGANRRIMAAKPSAGTSPVRYSQSLGCILLTISSSLSSEVASGRPDDASQCSKRQSMVLTSWCVLHVHCQELHLHDVSEVGTVSQTDGKARLGSRYPLANTCKPPGPDRRGSNRRYSAYSIANISASRPCQTSLTHYLGRDWWVACGKSWNPLDPLAFAFLLHQCINVKMGIKERGAPSF